MAEFFASRRRISVDSSSSLRTQVKKMQRSMWLIRIAIAREFHKQKLGIPYTCSIE